MKRVYHLKLASLVLVLILMISLGACTSAAVTTSNPASTAVATQTQTEATQTQAPGPDYLNFDSDLPIVKNGQNVTLSVIVSGDATFGDPKKIWFWEFVKRTMNINMDVQVTQDNDTWVSLAFASKNLPDILLCNLTASNLVRYGQDEGQIIAFNDYLNNTYMPNMNKLFMEHPKWLLEISAPDGKMYSAPKITDTESVTGVNMTGVPRFMINQNMLQQSNVSAPATLDELLSVLRSFKKLGNNIIPLGGGYEAYSPGYYLLNAYGYAGTDTKGFQVCTRNGKVVFPFGDSEVFGEYLKTMNTLYKEGLVSSDFFTLDETTVKAQVADNLIGILPTSVSDCNITDYKKYWGAKPLTSNYNSTPQWKMKSDGVTIGYCSVSSTCKYPEAACRFIDWLYDGTSQNSLLAWIGPSEKDTDLLYGMVSGYSFDPATGSRTYLDVTNGKYASAGECVKGSVAGFLERVGYMAKKIQAAYLLNNAENQYKELVYNDTNVKQAWEWDLYSMQENVKPYVIVDYPSIVFFSQEDNAEISDLKVVLESYAAQEIAKFIIGERQLTDSELKNYFDTLNSMGFADYLKYYSDYYSKSKE